MSTGLFFSWVIGVTSFTLLGSYYARKTEKSDLLVGLYVAFVLTSQILATKIASFQFGEYSFVGPAGVLVFAVTFLMTDIVNEKFGRRETHKMIMIAFFAQVAMSFFLWIGTKFPPDPTWGGKFDEAWNTFFGQIPRIMFASWAAFLVSENLDAILYAWFKRVTGGRMLWFRNMFSTIPTLALDSFIFIGIAFGGSGMALLPLMKGQIIIKWAVGVINIPFMYLNRRILEGPR
jgi:uncharacterized integral membrane protein (TIGR00697 family)